MRHVKKTLALGLLAGALMAGGASAKTLVYCSEGNPEARKIIGQVFEVSDREWRGIGNIPGSGYELRAEFSEYDANRKFDVRIPKVSESAECIAGQVLKGIKKPYECPQFGKKCKPQSPLGAPMVSSEGADGVTGATGVPGET